MAIFKPQQDNSGMAPAQNAPQRGLPAATQQQLGPIGKEAIVKANDLLREYKTGKDTLEARVKESEQWWKMRHWEQEEAAGNPVGNLYDRRPKSAWLFNVIAGKHADAIEAYPEPLILPREQADDEEAGRLTSIVPVILQQNEFETVYSANAWTKNISGTAVYGVFWDRSKLNGLGDVAVQKVSVLNLFWAPGVTDIQKSPHFFHVEKADTAALEAAYPHLKGQLKSGIGSFSLVEFETDDPVRDDKKTIVVDWFYKKPQNGKTVLHYCKYIGSNILFASENVPEMAEQGWYADGKYPYVFDALYPVEGSPCGFGYVEIGKSPQMSIDLLNQQLIKSAIINATPRVFLSDAAKINLEEFADITKPVVHVQGSLDDNSVRPIESPPPSSAALEMRNQIIEELKYTSSNMDVQNGGITAATAASAILAQMEAAGRTSKAATKGTYRAYQLITNMIIERIRQFYELPRQFRIIGKNGEQQFIQYSAEKLQAQQMGQAFGNDMGLRLPVFDVEVRVQKETSYSRLAQNELAVQLYGMGVFNPQMADQAGMLLDMMDFKGVEELKKKVQANNMMYQQLMMLQQMVMGPQAGPQGGPQGGPPNPQGVQPITPAPQEDRRMQRARATAQQAPVPQ